MPEPERILTSRRIPASASDVFRFITDPREQVAIDGSGMLVAAPDAHRLVAVGDSFEMDMDRESLGDVPLGKYRVVNTVTRIVVNKQLEWNVAWPGSPPFGHVYGYLLEAVGSDETQVSSYCDWSAISDEWRGHIHFPVVPKWMLELSLEKLEHALEARAQ